MLRKFSANEEKLMKNEFLILTDKNKGVGVEY